MLGKPYMRFSIALPWIAALLLQAILAGILLAKKMWGKFPFFLFYSVVSLAFSAGLYAAYLARAKQVYFVAYWLAEGLGLFLGLAVVYEVFSHLFASYPALRRLATQVFQAAIALLVLLGAILVYSQSLGEHNHTQAAFLVVEQVGRVLEVGLLLSLFIFASVFGLHWRQYVFGIALGLGIFVTVELVAVTMRVQFGMTGVPLFNVIRSISFNSSMVIWISYLLAPELAASPAEMPKHAQLEQWNRAVMELIYQ
jgi:hypothetical protein